VPAASGCETTERSKVIVTLPLLRLVFPGNQKSKHCIASQMALKNVENTKLHPISNWKAHHNTRVNEERAYEIGQQLLAGKGVTGRNPTGRHSTKVLTCHRGSRT
jgi:hypothetical protein